MNDLQTPGMLRCEYPYELKFFKTILCVFTCGGAAWAMVYWALTNEQGLRIRVYSKFLSFYLSAFEASLVYWVCGVVSLTFLIMLVTSLIASFKNRRKVILTDKEIICPQGSVLSKQVVSVKYKQIESLQITKNPGGILILTIYHTDGKAILSQTMLSKKLIHEIFEFLHKQI